MAKRKPCPTTTSKLAGYGREALLALLLQHDGVALHAAQSVGVSDSSMRRRLKALEITREEIDALVLERSSLGQGQTRESVNEDGSRTVVAGYTTLEDAVEGHGIDEDRWKVRDGWKANSWTAPNKAGGETHHHQITLRLDRRKPYDPRAAAARFEARVEAAARRAPKVKRIRRKPLHDVGIVAEPSIYDFHLGMAAEAAETGAETITLESSERLFRGAVERIAAKIKTRENVERIVFPFGNDFAHFNDRWGNTSNGTPQDRSASLHAVAESMETLLIEAIDRFKEIAPVEAIVVPGNHAHDVELSAARVLRAWYRNDENVEIDAGRNPFKFRRWQNVCLGWTHLKTRGKRIATKDLCGMFREMAGRLAEGATWCEWHVGHEHHKEAEEHYGVRMRMISSLAGPDSWHHHSGYAGAKRSAEVFFWHPVYGDDGRLPVSLREIEDCEGIRCAA